MSSFVFDEAAFQRFTGSVGGPVVRYLRSKGEAVNRNAYANASGPIIGIKTGRLRDNIGLGLAPKIVLADPPYAEVGSSGKDEHGFSYPWYHDQTRRPWLTSALTANGFRRL